VEPVAGALLPSVSNSVSPTKTISKLLSQEFTLTFQQLSATWCFRKLWRVFHVEIFVNPFVRDVAIIEAIARRNLADQTLDGGARHIQANGMYNFFNVAIIQVTKFAIR
jgi:hypothetical protein